MMKDVQFLLSFFALCCVFYLNFTFRFLSLFISSSSLMLNKDKAWDDDGSSREIRKITLLKRILILKRFFYCLMHKHSWKINSLCSLNFHKPKSNQKGFCERLLDVNSIKALLNTLLSYRFP